MAAKDDFDRNDLKDPDQFFETVGVVNRYVTENRNTVIAGVVAVVAFFVVVGSGFAYMDSARSQAAAKFARALSNVEDASPAAAKTGFAGAAEATNPGPYAALSHLFVGKIEGQGGDQSAAVAAYDRFLESGADEYLEQIALVGKAYSLESAERVGEAIDSYGKAADLQGPYTGQALESRARLAENSGDTATAITAVERLLTLEDSGIDTDRWGQKLEELRGPDGA